MTLHPLMKHIQDQQNRAAVLRELLRCLDTLDGYKECENLRVEMRQEACWIARTRHGTRQCKPAGNGGRVMSERNRRLYEIAGETCELAAMIEGLDVLHDAG